MLLNGSQYIKYLALLEECEIHLWRTPVGFRRKRIHSNLYPIVSEYLYSNLGFAYEVSYTTWYLVLFRTHADSPGFIVYGVLVLSILYSVLHIKTVHCG